ncbi:hypothetical protein AEQ18_06510 [Enterococcus sp. RIT-PI-f]|nr:hypothetical protein AEQ18_06510 [Enterococcus sp. RIT-PI-f]
MTSTSLSGLYFLIQKGGEHMKVVEDHMNTIIGVGIMIVIVVSLGALLIKYVPEQATSMLNKVTDYINTLSIGK